MASTTHTVTFSTGTRKGSYMYSVSVGKAIVPYLESSFRMTLGSVYATGTYYVGLSNLSSYNGSNPTTFLNYGYAYMSKNAGNTLSVSFNFKYPAAYTNLYCYVIRSGTSKLFNNNITCSLYQDYGDTFSFNIYKPTNATSISYNWNGGVNGSYTAISSGSAIKKNDIKYTDKLYVKVVYPTSKNPDHTICIAKYNTTIKGQISTSGSSGGTEQILTMNGGDIGFYYKQSGGSVTHGATGTRLDLYSIITNPFSPVTGLVYNGSSQTGVKGSHNSNLMSPSGSTGTNAGTYTFTAAAKSGYYFSHSGNSSASTITLTWSISKQTWELKDHCTPHNKRYNGSPQTILEFSTGTLPAGSSCGSTIEMHVADDLNNENAYIFDGYGSISKTNAGTYYFWGKAISLQNPNYVIGNKSNIDLGSAIIKRASDPMTFSVGTKSVYCTSDAKAASSTDSAKTVTIDAAAGNIGTVTYSITNRPNSNWTLSGKTLTIPSGTPAGDYSVTVQAEDDAGSNYTNTVRTSTFTVTVTAVTLQDGDYNSSNSGWWAGISIDNNNIKASGGSATITASASHVHIYYYKYSNGAVSGQMSREVSDGVSIDIDSQTCAGGTNRFSLSGSTLSHSTMGTTTGTDSITIIAKNNSNSEGRDTKTISVTNSMDSSSTAFNGRTQNCYQPYTDYRIINFASVGDIPAGGGTSYGQGTGQSRTCYTGSTYTKYDYYYLYTAYHDGDTSAKTHHYTSTKSGWTDGATPGCGSWGGDTTVKGSTISASSLKTTVRGRTYINTSSVNWNGATASADIYQAANSRTTVWDDMVWATPTVVFSNNSISAGGGSLVATATFSENNKRYYHYTYTDSSANESASAHIEPNYSTPDYGMYMSTPSHEDGWDDTNTWKCTGTWSSSLTVEHRNMAKSVTTDSANITAYNASANSAGVWKANTKTISVTNSVGAYYDTSVNTYGTPSLSLANNLKAGGGSVTVTCTVTDTYNTRRDYTSGSYDTSTRTADGTACWRITSNGNSRFSCSDTAHSHSSINYYNSVGLVMHSSMTSNVGTDTVGITAYNHADLSKTSGQKTASVSNSLNPKMYKSKSTSDPGYNATYGTPTISIGSGITASGGSAAITASVTNKAKWYQIYDSGTWTTEQSNYTGGVIANSVSLSIKSQSCAGGTNRFTLSGTTLSHSSMGKTTGTDSVTVTATNNANTGKTADASISVTNSVGAYYDTSVNTYGTPSLSLANNLTAGGGSVTVTCTVTDTYNTRRDYTSGSYDTSTRTVDGTACWRITSNGNNRFGYSGTAHTHSSTNYYYSGTTATHSSMIKNVGTDTVGITAYNHANLSKKSSEKTASVTNSVGAYYDTSVNTYGTPSLTLTNNLTAGGGSVTVTCSVKDTYNTRRDYTSGSYDTSTRTVDGTACWRITSNGNNRFGYSGTAHSHSSTNYYDNGTKATHSSMGKSVGTDTVGITAYNHNDLSQKSSEKTASVTNSVGAYYDTSVNTYGTPSLSLTNNLTAGGGSVTVTCTVTDTYNTRRDYTSGSYDTSTRTATGTACWRITSNGNSRFGYSGTAHSHSSTNYYDNGTKATHSSMGKSVGTDTVGITAYNHNDLSKKSSEKTASVTNEVGAYYDTSVNTYGIPSLTLTNNLTVSGGSVTVTCSVTDTYNTRRDYTSGSYDTSTRTATGTACWRITSNGNNRFAYSGSAHGHSSTNYYNSGTTATHSSMTTNATTDTVGITAYNHADLSKKSSEKTASVTNSSWWEYDNVTSCSISYSNSVCRNDNGITVSPSTSATQKKRIRYSTNSTSNETNCTITKTYSMTKGSGASINTSTGVITWEENKSTSARTSNTITCTFKGEGDKSNTATCTASQSAGYYTYATLSVSLSYNTNASCGSSSNTSPTNSPSLSYSQTYGWNGRTSGAGTVSSGASVSYSMTAGSGASSINSSTGVVTWSENQTLSSRTNNTVSVSVTLNGKTGSKSNVSTSQSAGYYTYATPSVGLSYNTNASCGSSSNTSPTNSPSLSYSQTYGWNGRTSGVGTVSSGASSVSYSMTAGSGASSINSSTGVVTWSENQTLSARTNNTVSVSVTVNGKTGSKSNVSTSQSAGYYTYSELSGGSLSYVNKNAASGTVSPSVSSPTQTYGWNGRTSGIGSCTVTAGNYSMKTGNGASINTSNGVITWEANKAGAQRTSNQVSRTYAGSGSKTKTLTTTATQLADAVSTHSATTSIGSGITAGGGSATVSGSCTRTWVSGYKDYPGISKVEITSQSRYTGVDLTGTASSITRYSVSSKTLSHTAMGTTTGSDYVKITTTFTDGCTATASTYVNNSRTTVWDDMVWATPTVVFSNNSISAGGGSLVATATFSENNKRYYHYTYTDSSANESASAHIEPNYSTPDYGMYMSTPSHEDGWDNTNTWKCTGTWTSSLTVEHRNMTTNVTTDSANITAYNASANSADVWKANTKTISVTNSIIPHDVRLGKCYYPTISAAGGTSNPVIVYYQDRYCTSGSKYDTVTSGATITYSVADPIKLDPLFYNGTNEVYTYNNSGGGTVTNERKSVSGTPSGVGIEIINKGSSSPGLGGWYFAYTGTAGQSYVCTFLAKIPTGRNVQFATNSVGNGGTYTWLSPQAGTGDWATYSMKVTFGTSPSSSFFFYLDGNFGTTSSPVTWYLGSAYLSKVTNVSSNTNVNTSTGAITMGTLGTTVQDATARSSYGIYATITLNGKSSYVAMYPEQAANVKDKNVTGLNERTQNCYQSYTDYRIINFASVGNIPASGGSSYAQGTGQSRTCYSGSSYTKYDYYYLYSAYYSGDTDAKTFSYSNTKSGWKDGATPGCGSWGNVETVTGSTVTVSSLGTTVKAVTKVGTSSVTWHSKTASADISQAENKLESISIVLGNSAVSKPGGDASGHPSSAHYDLAYNSTTSPTVTATYTSGSTANVTSSSKITSSDTTVATVS